MIRHNIIKLKVKVPIFLFIKTVIYIYIYIERERERERRLYIADEHVNLHVRYTKESVCHNHKGITARFDPANIYIFPGIILSTQKTDNVKWY